MLLKTKGIVFRQFKYGETGKIVKIYTKERGLMGFIIKGIRNKKSSTPVSLFQNLSILELVTSWNEKKDLHFIKEATQAHAYRTIPSDIKKSTVILFLNEILYKVIREEEANRELFTFIEQSLIHFDGQESNFSNFHIYFLSALTRFIGFHPSQEQRSDSRFFDMNEGRFTDIQPPHKYCIHPPESLLFRDILNTSLAEYEKVNIVKASRIELLDKILEYYRLHLPALQEIKSFGILQSLMR